MRFPSPKQIKQELPLKDPDKVSFFRERAIQVLERKDPRLALIVGPCSIHDEASTYEYAQKLKSILPDIQDVFFPVMRFFFEKPRTRLGWKGMLYDPHLDGSNDLEKGVRVSRELLLKITDLGIPCATELLDPLAFSYFDDLITWGVIGARTSSSQTHRQLASRASFPIGFKNDFRGNANVAIDGILAAHSSHSYLGIDLDGRAEDQVSSGNPFTHLILRGSDLATNYDPLSIEAVQKSLLAEGLPPYVMIDCSHGNCSKNFEKQKEVFSSVIEQSHSSLIGLMLESHLYSGKQTLSPHLHYGVSITDSCLGWEETEDLLKSICLVQNWCSQTSTISPLESMTSNL